MFPGQKISSFSLMGKTAEGIMIDVDSDRDRAVRRIQEVEGVVEVHVHNVEQYGRGKSSIYKAKDKVISKFAEGQLVHHQKIMLFLLFQISHKTFEINSTLNAESLGQNQPETYDFDWSSQGLFVSNVRNQGRKDLCWGIGLTLTGEARVNQGKLENEKVSLSPQDVINGIKYGDETGKLDKSQTTSVESLKLPLRWMVEHGVVQEADCPFKDGIIEKHSRSRLNHEIVRFAGPGMKQDCTDDDIMKVLQKHPVAGSLKICSKFGTLKEGEIYTGPQAASSSSSSQRKGKREQPKELEHCVVISGWGYEGNTRYFNIINSYGEGWANKGRGRVLMKENSNVSSLFSSICWLEIAPDRNKEA
ncbi:hypothetical protein Tsubulata_004125 [Turnera subulata]|uniref:Peptidase C1A papain C-terminal domain-containing protein n=1 Tax=Turnera subulata TaxID=218843 RepID=A0A9Q0F2I4_9ROSI|nr:hypothetical protein Tsubulata_004125 [Turnera subulata]